MFQLIVVWLSQLQVVNTTWEYEVIASRFSLFRNWRYSPNLPGWKFSKCVMISNIHARQLKPRVYATIEFDHSHRLNTLILLEIKFYSWVQFSDLLSQGFILIAQHKVIVSAAVAALSLNLESEDAAGAELLSELCKSCVVAIKIMQWNFCVPFGSNMTSMNSTHGQ